MEGVPQQDVCRVCTRQYARYTCPRCRLRYCSKDCYQQHSQQCTESFFRESAVAELRSTAASDEERQNMQEILRRVHDNDDGGAAMAAVLGMPPIGDTGATSGGRDDNSGSGSASDEDDVTAEAPLSVATLQRLLAAAEAGGELDAALEQLDPRELRQFERFLASGEAPKLVERWQPWWYSPEAGALRLTARGTRPVKPLGEADTPEEPGAQPPGVAAAASPVPEPTSRPLPPVRTASGRSPSPRVRWRLLEALYGYALTLRLFNGDWAPDPGSAADVLLAAAPFLGAQAAGEPPETGAEAVLHAVLRACAPGGPAAGDRRLANLILGDVAAIAALGRAAAVCALADAQRLVAAARAVAPQPPRRDAQAGAAQGAGGGCASGVTSTGRHGGGASPAPDDAAGTAQHGSIGQTRAQAEAAGSGGGGGGRSSGSAADRQLRRALRLAEVQLGGFLLPWANEQLQPVFVDIAQAVSEEWEHWRESTGQTEQTGNVPASAARLSAQPRPLGTSGAGQQPGRPRIVEMAADGSPDESAGAPSGRALGTIAAEARPLDGRSARGVSSRSLLAPRLAASVGAMSVNPGTADQQHRHHKPVIEELS